MAPGKSEKTTNASGSATAVSAADARLAGTGRGLAKMLEGLVVSNKMNKSVVVGITTRKKHGTYGKYMKNTKRYVAHDEQNSCQVGDRVQIIECRPLSKTKRWRVQNIVERAA